MKKVIGLVVFLLTIALTGCTNEQIQQAIDDCKGDAECTVIVDELIEEELKERGIQDGSMTLQELEEVYQALEANIYTSEFYTEDYYYEFLEYVSWGYEILSSNNDYENEVLNEVLTNYEFTRRNDVNEYLNLRDINTENKQYLVQDGTKYIVYKENSSQYVYEVYGDRFYTFLVDTELDKIYIGNEQLINEEKPFLELINGEYNTENVFFHKDESTVYMRYKDTNKWTYIIADLENRVINELHIMDYSEGGAWKVFLTIKESTSSNIDQVEVIFQEFSGSLTELFQYIKINSNMLFGGSNHAEAFLDTYLEFEPSFDYFNENTITLVDNLKQFTVTVNNYDNSLLLEKEFYFGYPIDVSGNYIIPDKPGYNTIGVTIDEEYMREYDISVNVEYELYENILVSIPQSEHLTWTYGYEDMILYAIYQYNIGTEIYAYSITDGTTIKLEKPETKQEQWGMYKEVVNDKLYVINAYNLGTMVTIYDLTTLTLIDTVAYTTADLNIGDFLYTGTIAEYIVFGDRDNSYMFDITNMSLHTNVMPPEVAAYEHNDFSKDSSYYVYPVSDTCDLYEIGDNEYFQLPYDQTMYSNCYIRYIFDVYAVRMLYDGGTYTTEVFNMDTNQTVLTVATEDNYMPFFTYHYYNELLYIVEQMSEVDYGIYEVDVDNTTITNKHEDLGISSIYFVEFDNNYIYYATFERELIKLSLDDFLSEIISPEYETTSPVMDALGSFIITDNHIVIDVQGEMGSKVAVYSMNDFADLVLLEPMTEKYWYEFGVGAMEPYVYNNKIYMVRTGVDNEVITEIVEHKID